MAAKTLPTIPLAQDVDPAFTHAVLAQVGLPRSPTDVRTFERHNGTASILLEAGSLFDGSKFVAQPLPSGTRPRLVLVHVCTEAVRTRKRQIEIGHSVREFLRKLGIDAGGKSMAYFRREMCALAACRMTIGVPAEDGAETIDAKPISKFKAWVSADERQTAMWPGTLELSPAFFESVLAHAVPLNPHAIAELQNSALALDIYTWTAHRLCRIRSNAGVRLSWGNLHEQFGANEYADLKDFRKRFLGGMKRALAVYPEARIETVRGGLRLLPSPPPIKKVAVVVALPSPALPKPAAKPAPVVRFITEEALDRVRTLAPGWDRQFLLARYREWTSGKPEPDNPDAAFLGWVKRFTKGKRPD